MKITANIPYFYDLYRLEKRANFGDESDLLRNLLRSREKKMERYEIIGKSDFVIACVWVLFCLDYFSMWTWVFHFICIFFLTEVLAKQLSTIMGIKKKREKEKERRKKRMRMKKKCDQKSIGESKIDWHKWSISNF